MNMNKLFLTEKEVDERLNGKYHLQHNVLRKIDIQIIPHYGWLPCFFLKFDGYYPVSPHNNTKNLGYIIHQFMQLFDIREDGEYLSNVVDKDVRLVLDDARPFEGGCVAVGHPWKDKFIFIEDLMKASDVKID